MKIYYVFSSPQIKEWLLNQRWVYVPTTKGVWTLKIGQINIPVNSLMWSTIGLNWYLETSRLLLQPSGRLDMFLMCLLKQLLALELCVILVQWFFLWARDLKIAQHTIDLLWVVATTSARLCSDTAQPQNCWKVETVSLQTRQFSCLACGLLPRSSFSYNDEADYV